MKILSICILLFSTTVADICLAWGERGHDLVTRAAIKNLAKMSNHDDKFIRPFSLRNHMLSHLSNVPDFHWRANYMSKVDRDANYTTHFIGVESVYPGAERLSDISQKYNDFVAIAQAKNGPSAEQIGTAPWRILQLHAKMVEALRLASEVEDGKARVAATDQALLYAGLMSHFVGDLANPHHTTINYDGQLSGNKGLHAYFESDVVRELPMTLAGRIESSAGTHRLRRTVLNNYSRQEQNKIMQNQKELIFALLLNSHSLVDKLHQLDDKYSILVRGKDSETYASRRDPSKVMNNYRKMVVERLAVGASVLAQLWILAWEQAGSPDLSNYRSYEYHVAPDFISPDYLIE